MAKKKKSGKMGVRYTDAQKAEILQFVRDHDRAKGRGGQSAAAKKFGVSALSIANWSKKSGKVAPKKQAVVKKTAAARPTTSEATVGSAAATLQRMIAIQEQLEALQAEYVALKSRL